MLYIDIKINISKKKKLNFITESISKIRNIKV